MDELKSVVSSVKTVKSYGNISFHFNTILKAKGVTRYRLATLANVTFRIADKLCKGTVERMDLDVLARVCYVLGCEVGDVLKYEKPSPESTENSPENGG